MGGCAASKDVKDDPASTPRGRLQSTNSDERKVVQGGRSVKGPTAGGQTRAIAAMEKDKGASGLVSGAGGKQKKFGQIQPGQQSTDKDAAEVEAEKAQIRKHLSPRNKSVEDKAVLRQALKNHVVCSSLDEGEVDGLLDSMEFFLFKAGETVCKQGDMGSYFFIAFEGKFEVFVDGKKVNTMERGKAFGEIALILNGARSATVKAVTAGALYGVQRGAFREVLMHMSTRNFAENRQFLDGVKFFEGLTDKQKNMICNVLTVEKLQDKQVLVRQGEKGDKLFIVKEGTLEVAIEGKGVVRQLTKGEYFGERALIYDEPRSATVTAKGEAVCNCIGRDLLSQVLGDLQSVLFGNMKLIALQTNAFFAHFEKDKLATVAGSMDVREFIEGEAVVEKSTQNDGSAVRFVIVVDGEVSVKSPSGQATSLLRGQSFGEEYVKDPKKPFQHALVSKGHSKVALLTTSAVIRIFGGAAGEDAALAVEGALDFSSRKAALKKVYIFRNLADAQLDNLAKALKETKFQKGNNVIKQGEMGTKFFVIKNGEVAIYRSEKQIRTCGKGDYFGERALLYDEARTATVTVTSASVDVWAIDRGPFLSVLEGPMLEHLEERIALQDSKVSMSDLEVLRVVGRGTFGTVKLVKHKQTGTRYALKCMSKRRVIELNQQDRVQLEREILAENDHPFIIHLVRTFKDRDYLFFLTELVTGGELYDAIRQLDVLDRYQSQFYLASLILAIECLHDRNIVYRDLKPENVLLDSQGYCKLIDFGCAKKLGPGNRTYTILGTPHYMAPEIILGKGYGLSADIWALGVILFEFMCICLPFGHDAEDQMEIFRAVLTAKLAFPSSLKDRDAADLMKRLLCRVPEVRIGCSRNQLKDVKEHSFFSDFNYDRLIGRQMKPPLKPKAENYCDDDPGADEREVFKGPPLKDSYSWDAEF
uniref:cGMP-dependent protein kinase n=1 Tax=Chromera velia CCMP2878 TaxID=1169474 RepID=A0A0G4FJS5_9ALVE|mmetsp:Transcript_19921/g.40043  ORF Transcript_19921/g.40043 Transcript_19921/m.40043 type:complete len:930 (-) Transcript_19921:480-3269(-)|eukprot:Cvel_17404.t1-p1 / transcript=Cvel_17404.t1 / gene=Cvel_17404 / organism=Chromera_velia_CCMP2878 / gene_product=cGMP-dependent protein kinase 1, putative / transcript_product=cGMP-dependent protein kinase 1, putative / location=Cvel_scaffold1386:493-18092(-) / protein_length=929 / sequence_SO=supercontig / SO=protein_coding / is_pseudo=false